MRLSRTQRRDVFSAAQAAETADPRDATRWRPQPPRLVQGLLSVLAVEVLQPARLDGLFRNMVAAFPDLTYYDADISIALRHAARYDVFPLAAPPPGSARRNDPQPGSAGYPLGAGTGTGAPAHPQPRTGLRPRPQRSQSHPGLVWQGHYSLPFEQPEPFLIGLRADLRRYDPDVILGSWGDTWLLPFLMKLSQETGIALPLNRDESQPLVERKELTYFSYGQIVYRGRQVPPARALAPRPAQRYALGRLWSHRRARDGARHPPARPGGRPPLSRHRHLLHAVRHRPAERHPDPLAQAAGRDAQDRPATCCAPTWAAWSTSPPSGLHRDVGGIDFVSMYPGIMVRFNISPEVPRAGNDPGTGARASRALSR